MSDREPEPVSLPALVERPAAATPAPIDVGAIDLVAAWLSGRKETTRLAYGKDLDDFARFHGQTRAGAVELLLAAGQGGANAIALAYRAHLHERKLSPATIG